MRRRDFVQTAGASLVLWPLAGGAQQGPTPLIGYLHPFSADSNAHLAAIIRRHLADAGFVEGRNLSVEYRFAEGRYDRLPVMAADLVRREVAVILAPNTPAALAAKAATATIPIVFSAADDPVELGLVASLARPGGNATGVHFFNSGLAAKQLGLLHELLPRSRRFGLLINPTNTNSQAVRREVTVAASAIGVEIDVVEAKDLREIETAFTTLVHSRAEALVVASDPLFYGRRLQLAILAARHAIPAVYNSRDYAEAGGLLTYGTSLREVYHHMGIYAGRILKGENPSGLPVVQSIKFELVVNLPTARALGLDLPPMLLARADEVIE